MGKKHTRAQASASNQPADESLDYRDEQALAAFLQALLRKANRPVRMDELMRMAYLPRKAKKKVETALHALQELGQAARAGGGWVFSGGLKYTEGVLSVQRAGMGFVTPVQGGPDIYIHPAAMGDAWHGDSVEVLVLPGKRGPSREGRVTRVLRRGREELPVHAIRRQKNGAWLCAPANTRIQALFVTDMSALEKDAAEGDLLLVRPGEKSGPNLWLAAATVNFEHEESPAAQERIAKSNHGIPGPFPHAVLAAVGHLPANPAEADYSGRRDLRELDFVTIDGRTARDFDDAIHVEADGKGFRLRVAIADVSHYVRMGAALDVEAQARGNSCYFPLSVEPMLPEALSNGLCSLNPGVPRLVMVADMRFSAAGEPRKADFFSAVISSKARLTYGQIERGLLLGEEEESEGLKPFLPMLERAEALARRLLEQRRQRGSLDFDLPEAEFSFNDKGEVSGVFPRKRHFGHRMIEECMIAANEAVARFLEHKGQPVLYRVHQPPDPEKLLGLERFFTQAGMAARKPQGKGRQGKSLPTVQDLQRMLAEAAGTPREYIVTRLLLRAMMQARYQPENEGHFGLASEAYCHFTSPIRRYADLTAHRALKQALGIAPSGEGKAFSIPRLEAVAEHCNSMERGAVDAERELLKRLSVLFLRDHVGEVREGVISGVTEFGLFVELPSCLAEGMIRLGTLENDYFDYLSDRQELRGRRTRQSFRLGQQVRVRITDVHLGRQEINLVLERDALQNAPTGERALPSRRGSARPRRPREGSGAAPRRGKKK